MSYIETTVSDVIAEDGYLFSLKPEDTKGLPSDTYYYDIGLQKANGEFYQVIPTGIFKINPAITEKEE